MELGLEILRHFLIAYGAFLLDRRLIQNALLMNLWVKQEALSVLNLSTGFVQEAIEI